MVFAKKQNIDPTRVIDRPTSITGLRPYLSDTGPKNSVRRAMASIERLRVSCATSVLTSKVSLITGKAGNKICMAAGPSADVAASKTMSVFDNEVRVGKAIFHQWYVH